MRRAGGIVEAANDHTHSILGKDCVTRRYFQRHDARCFPILCAAYGNQRGATAQLQLICIAPRCVYEFESEKALSALGPHPGIRTTFFTMISAESVLRWNLLEPALCIQKLYHHFESALVMHVHMYFVAIGLLERYLLHFSVSPSSEHRSNIL